MQKRYIVGILMFLVFPNTSLNTSNIAATSQVFSFVLKHDSVWMLSHSWLLFRSSNGQAEAVTFQWWAWRLYCCFCACVFTGVSI